MTATPTISISWAAACCNDNLQWSSVMLAYMSRTPDKALLGDRWREVWLNRLKNQPLLVANG